jgi:hypothetical protein
MFQPFRHLIPSLLVKLLQVRSIGILRDKRMDGIGYYAINITIFHHKVCTLRQSHQRQRLERFVLADIYRHQGIYILRQQNIQDEHCYCETC